MIITSYYINIWNKILANPIDLTEKILYNQRMISPSRQASGFTLIEMSIVLVIIGLVVGGVMTGRDLIDAASQRAQLTQIEKYNTAVRTFQVKYGYLPGDIPDPVAKNFGFITRGSGQGTGNGDGIIAGANCNGGGGCTTSSMEAAGESVVLWVDLSAAGLIEGKFNTATSYTPAGADVTGAAIGNYFPQARIGQGNYVYVWPGGTWSGGSGSLYNGRNYFGVSAVTNIKASTDFGKPASAPGFTVQQAYNIDRKIDDGYPQTGSVIAVYIHHDPYWTDGTDTLWSGETTPNTSAITGDATTCYDNGNNNGATQQYSITQNGGNGMNCALSFKFQ